MTEPTLDARMLDAITSLVTDALPGGTTPLVLGLCGAQGSGKSTLAAALAARFEADGIATAILSIDDLYRTRAERRTMARTIHPLFATRGVPGTHDVGLALDIFAALDAGLQTRLPRFDKAADDRLPISDSPAVSPAIRLIIFEGWCVGARPQTDDALIDPVNALEADEDRDGLWRRAANIALAGDYQCLFARIDCLVLLAAPGFEQVLGWRIEQEHALRARTGGGMTDAQIARFIQHYERLTRHILDEMPARADLTIRLASDRSVRRIG